MTGAASPIGRQRSLSETAAQRAKLDSDKFGDGAGDETGGVTESYTRLNFSITTILYFNSITMMLYFNSITMIVYFNALCNMINMWPDIGTVLQLVQEKWRVAQGDPLFLRAGGLRKFLKSSYTRLQSSYTKN